MRWPVGKSIFQRDEEGGWWMGWRFSVAVEFGERSTWISRQPLEVDSKRRTGKASTSSLEKITARPLQRARADFRSV